MYLSFSQNKKKDYKISLISIEGNDHLTKEQYLEYANLTDRNNYGNLTLQLVKDRIGKHPYIKSTDVRYDGDPFTKAGMFTNVTIVRMNKGQFNPQAAEGA